MSVLSNRKPLAWVILIALAIRLIAVPLVHRIAYTSDEREYVRLGKMLAHEAAFIDSNGERSSHSPFYPMVLAGLFLVGGDSLGLPLLLGCVLGALAIWLGVHLSMRLSNSETVALIVGVVIALYPGLVVYSALLQTEALFIVLFLLAFVSLYRLVESPTPFNIVAFGIVSGLATLTRAVFLGCFPLLLVSIVLMMRKRGQRPLIPAAGAAAFFLLTLAPWAIRDYHTHGRLLLGTSTSGRLFLLGNNPYATGTWSVKPGFMQWFEQQAADRGVTNISALDELSLRSLSTDVALAYIIHNPLVAIQLALKKTHIILAYPITHSDSFVPLQALAVGTDFVLLIGVALGIVSTRGLRMKLAPVYFTVAYFLLTQIVLEAEARNRLPLVPLLGLFFGWGVFEILDKDRRAAFFANRRVCFFFAGMAAAIILIYSYTGLLFVSGKI